MLKIYGHSDDIIVLDGDRADEFSDGDVIVIGQREATQGVDAHGVMVRMAYAPDWARAVWVAEVAPIDEDVEIPWRIEIALSERKYSAVVTVHCPRETPVIVLRDGDIIWRDGEWFDRQ